jgi:hypothetical protein
MIVDQAYLDLLNSKLELRIKLAKEEIITTRNQEKIRKLIKEIEACERYISHLEKNLVSREDEIDRLKADYQSTLHDLKKCQDHLELKEEALSAQDERIILLEDTVEKLKTQILEISLFQINNNSDQRHSGKEHQENMALPDILVNIGLALDRVETYIDGDTSFNPKNTLNGIRISITQIRDHMRRHVQDAIDLQGLLNTTNGRINGLMNDLTNTRNDLLNFQRREEMITNAWRDERRVRQIGDANIIDLRNGLCRNIREMCMWKRRYTACAQQAHNLKRDYRQGRTEIGLLFNRYQKWKARELNSRQIILNLQNNPLGNMATIQDVTISMAPILAQIPQYIGQETPDDYFNKVMQAINYGHNLAVAGFNDAMKVTVLSGKMGGRFIPPNPFNNNAGNVVNTPALFQAWLRDKYREVKIGTAQASMKALMYEKFNTIDTPETYEKRIRPHVDGMPYADALPILLNHLPENLEIRVRIANPADLNAFFTELNNKWLEAGGPSMTAQVIQQIPGPYGTLPLRL